MLKRYIGVKLEKLLPFDSKAGYLLRKTIETITGTESNYGADALADWLEWPNIALREWLDGIPNGYGYDSFKIRKKRGRGLREIDAPNHNLKSLQQRVYHKLLKPLKVHQAATAYVPGRSILDNALPHVNQEVVINIDLKDFFTNISSNRVYRYWHLIGWDVEAATILKNICCYNGHLPQGAPTSPALSNLCNQLLDARLEGIAKKGKGQYTRYADDLTFSFPTFDSRQQGYLGMVFQILASEDYEIQKKKRVRIQRRHQRQTTTGLVVNEKVNLPRETRRRIRAMRHHLSKGTLSEKDERRLKGYESLLQMISGVNTSEVPEPFPIDNLNTEELPRSAAQAMASEKEKSIKNQLLQHQRNLNKLKEQEAIYGTGEAPLYLLNKIDSEEDDIAELKADLEKLRNASPPAD